MEKNKPDSPFPFSNRVTEKKTQSPFPFSNRVTEKNKPDSPFPFSNRVTEKNLRTILLSTGWVEIFFLVLNRVATGKHTSFITCRYN